MVKTSVGNLPGVCETDQDCSVSSLSGVIDRINAKKSLRAGLLFSTNSCSSGSCPGLTSSVSAYTANAGDSGDVNDDIQKSLQSCASTSFGDEVKGAGESLLGMITGGLTNQFFTPVDNGYLTKLQDDYNNLNNQFNACIQSCKDQLQGDEQTLMCCQMRLLNDWFTNNYTKLSQDLQENKLLTYLALSLIILILVYILTS